MSPFLRLNLTNAVLELEARTHTKAVSFCLGDCQNELGLLGDERVLLTKQLGHLGEERNNLIHRLGHCFVLGLLDIVREIG